MFVSRKRTHSVELQAELGTISLKHHFYLKECQILVVRVGYRAGIFSNIKEVSLSRKTTGSSVVNDEIQTLK